MTQKSLSGEEILALSTDEQRRELIANNPYLDPEYKVKVLMAENDRLRAELDRRVDVFGDVFELHKAICPGQIGEKPAIHTEHKELRKRLIREEVVKELLVALELDDLEGIADGCIDAMVVIIGTLVAYGLPGPALWREVQRANMAKKDGPMRADGKRLKPEGWEPPDIAGVIRWALTEKFLET